MPTIYNIRLSQPSGVYYAGQTLRGIVYFTTDEIKIFRDILILVSGKAAVRWKEDRRKIHNITDPLSVYRVPEFTNSKELLPSKNYFTEPLSCFEMQLKPGSYESSFECSLPQHLPTSFIGSLGYIKYEIKFIIVCVRANDDIFTQAFTVINPVDLNLYPNCREPAEISEVKSFYGLSCCYGPLHVKLTTPQIGYVPGQKIHFKLLINNESNVNIDQTCVGFNRKTIYESRWLEVKQKRTFETISKKEFGSLLKFKEKEFRGHITLPSVPPTSMNNFKMIRFGYYLYAYILTEGMHNNIRIIMPIKVGTTPLLHEQQAPEAPILEISLEIPTAPPETPTSETPMEIPTAPPETPTSETPTSETPMEIPIAPLETPIVILEQPRSTRTRPTVISSMSSEGLPSYESLQPPTYEEAIQLELIPLELGYNEHQNGPFIPKYPVYHNWDPSDVSDSEAD